MELGFATPMHLRGYISIDKIFKTFG